MGNLKVERNEDNCAFSGLICIAYGCLARRGKSLLPKTRIENTHRWSFAGHYQAHWTRELVVQTMSYVVTSRTSHRHRDDSCTRRVHRESYTGSDSSIPCLLLTLSLCRARLHTLFTSYKSGWGLVYPSIWQAFPQTFFLTWIKLSFLHRIRSRPLSCGLVISRFIRLVDMRDIRPQRLNEIWTIQVGLNRQ